MKNTIKSLLCLVLAAAMLFAFAGCKSSEMSWSAKYDGETLPIGTYIYFLAYSASEASSKVEDSETPVLKQQIEGKDAETWIRDRAIFYLRNYFAVQKMMKDRGLALSEEQLQQAKSMASSYWANMSSSMDSYGVAFTSYEKAVQEQVAISVLFDAIYGEDGEIETPLSEMKEYFESNYFNYSYAIIGLYKENEEGESERLEGDALEAAKAEIDGWIEDYNSGKIDKDGFVKLYTASDYFFNEEMEADEYKLGETTGKMDETSDFGKALAETEIGKAASVDYSSSGFYYIIFKDDIKELSATYIAEASNRTALISEMHQGDFDDLVEKAAESIEVEFNEKAFAKQDLSKFFTTK